MEVVGFVMGLAPLVDLAMAVKDNVHNLRINDALKTLLQERAEKLISALRDVPETSEEAMRVFNGLILEDLKDVDETLKSVITRGSVVGFIKATSVNKKLQKCQATLERLTGQVQSFIAELRRIHDTPTIANDMAEGPVSEAGLDRASCILEFLGRSASQDLRVVCIHGLPGLGKTTLLYQVWNAASKKAPFLAQAFVQIGENATNKNICRLQNEILRQLNWPNKEFATIDFGKQELKKCFEQRKEDSKPLFLAIDNVFSRDDLEHLLPSTPLITLLPPKSCIALTCRDRRVAQSLLSNCNLQENNKLQVLCFNPPLLSSDEAMRVLVGGARMQQDSITENKDLLEALVSHCNGLPLALTVLGNTIKETSTGVRKTLQQLEKHMVTLDDDEGDTYPIQKALQISYDSLPKLLQEAFLDIVEVFYGWPWDVVECIVGESKMKRLKDSSLISPVDNLWKCNQGAMAENLRSIRNCLDYFGANRHPRSSAVWMHDLVFKFGKSALHNVSSHQQLQSGLSQSSSTLKTNVKHTELQSHVEDPRNLQLLAIVSSSPHYNVFEYGYFKKAFSSQQGKGRLKALLLSGLDESANSIIQTLVSDEIRFMQLEYCREFRSLPDTFPLKELQVLRVRRCHAFNNFSVQGWDNLKFLFIKDCPALITVPDALASLPNLETVRIEECTHLQEFPPLRGPHGPFELTLENCTDLRRMGDISCRLESVSLIDLMLQELPYFHSACLETLRDLSVVYCRQLQELPDSICSLKALRELHVEGCDSLVDLPHNIGDLACLEEFQLWVCMKLQQLPDSICNLKALRELYVEECHSLVDLPHNIGDLASLEKFWLKRCTKLQQLPDSICSLKALRELNLGGCGSLDLPQNIGDLADLTIFR